MRRLLRVFATMGSFAVVNVLVGVARAKLGAVILEPSGVGLLAQIGGLQILFQTAWSLGTGTAVTRRVAETVDEDPSALRAALDSAFRLLALSSLAGTVVLTVASPLIARLMLDSSTLAWALLPFLATVGLDVMTGSFTQAIILGSGRYDLYTRASIAAAAAGLVPFVIGAWAWGVRGAIISVGVSSVLRFALFWMYAVRSLRVQWRPALRRPGPRGEARALVRFGLGMLAVGGATELSNIGVRTLILHILGAAANGVFQVPVAATAYYSVLFTNVVWAHTHPALSRPLGPEERAREVEDTVRFTTIGLGVVGAVLLTVWPQMTEALYSSAFVTTRWLATWYIVGNTWMFIALVYAGSFLALPRVRIYVYLWVGYSAARLFGSWLGLEWNGVSGAAVAYAASSCGLVVASLVAHRRAVGIALSRSTAALVATSAPMLALPELAPNRGIAGALHAVALGGWMLVALRPGEARALLRLIRRTDSIEPSGPATSGHAP